MPELVTPELTLVRVADKEVLNEYATARTAAGASVDRHLKANLSQLLGTVLPDAPPVLPDAQERDSTIASDEEECEACEADEGCDEGNTEVESEPEEPEEVEPEEAEVERLEAASDSEAEEDGAGDLVFEFDENGGRIRPEEEAAHMAEEEAEMETRGAVVEQPSASRSSRRRSRQVQILQQAAGQEHTTQGETRTEQQGQRAQGIFTAQKYFWM
ncbi:hypothetical protein Ctob_003941 [Chrysochromulina tobinii]|uniref:Uncharacterized protein n=1 Tax=Chrysochromulina tobinii TaxID=1460289 RepID=A0A0M0J2V0_9EUKA|nr:hypothetical protein Ctob_003941 [Chrysochromulina tobinii]|eukprot:KOO20871.1 hypothetical protein Ctob_003941 [Chrysochromulina sp. CCMP291]